jgi:hypothetical protein
MSLLAAVRPDEQNLWLFIHVAGAMVLVGALVLSALALQGAWRNGSVASIRLGYRSLLVAALPAWVVMRVGAQLIADKQGWNDVPDDAIPSWIEWGFIAAEPGLLFIIIATVLTGRSVRKLGDSAEGPTPTKVRVATVLVSLMIVLYLVALWAMTTKPA